MIMAILLQAAERVGQPGEPTLLDHVLTFLDSPAPYSPFSEYLLLLFVLWFIARRHNRKRTFDAQAQEVLDEKYARGELSKSAYDKFRQDVALRQKR